MNLALWVSTAVIAIVNASPTTPSTFKCYKCYHRYGTGTTDVCSDVSSITQVETCSTSCVTTISFDLNLHIVKDVLRMCGELKNKNCTQDTCYDNCYTDKCNNRPATIACDSNPCQNGAKCKENNGAYTCTCIAGYTGANCETDIDECASKPCLNNATCRDNVNAYVCLCKTGYVGKKCEVRGVMCYTCSYVWTADPAKTRECVYDPESVKTGAKAIPCPYPRYCTTIRRIDYNLPSPKEGILGWTGKKGDIRSFVRMCDTVNRGNYCVKEINFDRESCYSTCRKSNCNEGDGRPITKNNNNGTMTNTLDWPQLFNVNAHLTGNPTTTVSYALVGLFAFVALLNM